MVSCFVDADHAGNQVTRHSHTGIIIFCNRAPIIWFSKRQNTVETSSFGSEFVTLHIAVELIESIRYKLCMFGIPIQGAANVYCDNASVVVNSQSQSPPYDANTMPSLTIVSGRQLQQVPFV